MSGAERNRLYRERKKQLQVGVVPSYQFSPVRNRNGMTEAGYLMNAIIEVKVGLTNAYLASSKWQFEYGNDGGEAVGLRHIKEVERETVRAVRSLERLAGLLPFSAEVASRVRWDYP